MSAGVAPLIMVAQCCVMRTLIQRLSAVALNLKENPAKEKRAGWERVLGGDVQETNAPWIAASRCECSEAMLCQRGGKTGYRRTAVRHKFAASIQFTANYLFVMMRPGINLGRARLSGHARPRSHLSELWVVITPPTARSFPPSGRASGAPVLGVRNVWRSRARRAGHL
jgi:hypothetical protein